MSFVVCLIDDALLRVDREPKLLSECQINNKILDIAPEEDAEEHEKNLQAFIESIISQTDMTLYGYTNPTFYNSNIGQHPAFDVVIYDWDYAGSGGVIDPAEQLEKLINDSHCFVYVYSHMNDDVHKGQIEAIMAKNPHRIDFLLKGETNSAETLKTKIQAYQNSSFSAQFAQQLRVNASKSVEKILVRLAHLDIDKFHQMMGTNDEEKRKDLVEFISEKFKNELMGMDFSIPEGEEVAESEATVTEIAEVSDSTNSTIKELWHYRMYSTINDERVRKGDIYKKSDNEYIMIMTPNCQLVRYHSGKKTLGIFNFVKLISTEYAKGFVLEHITVPESGKLKKPIGNSNGDAPSSLINQIGKDAAPFFLPSVKIIDQTNTLDLLLFPKMFSYEKFKTDEAKTYLGKVNLLANGYSYQTTLSEPFLSELTKEVFDKLQGNGVPDYTQDMKNNIKQSLNTTIFS